MPSKEAPVAVDRVRRLICRFTAADPMEGRVGRRPVAMLCIFTFGDFKPIGRFEDLNSFSKKDRHIIS